jgi:hypothetical protein
MVLNIVARLSVDPFSLPKGEGQSHLEM